MVAQHAGRVAAAGAELMTLAQYVGSGEQGLRGAAFDCNRAIWEEVHHLLLHALGLCP